MLSCCDADRVRRGVLEGWIRSVGDHEMFDDKATHSVVVFKRKRDDLLGRRGFDGAVTL